MNEAHHYYHRGTPNCPIRLKTRHAWFLGTAKQAFRQPMRLLQIYFQNPSAVKYWLLLRGSMLPNCDHSASPWNWARKTSGT